MISDRFTSTLRAGNYDGSRGSLRQIVELLARAMVPNAIAVISKATSSTAKRWVRLDAATGHRIVGTNGSGTSLTFRRNGSNTADVAATLSTDLVGANNDLVFTAKELGAVGNNITVAYVDPSGDNQALAIVVTAQAIVANLATGAGGAITSTAAQIKAAIEASAPANALVSVANKADNDGSGVVTALGATNLANGADTAVATVVVASTAAVDLPCVANANEWDVKRTDDSGTPATLHAFLHNTV